VDAGASASRPRTRSRAQQSPLYASGSSDLLLTLPIAVPGLATALALILPLRPVSASFARAGSSSSVSTALHPCPSWCESVLRGDAAVDLRTLEEAAAEPGRHFPQRFVVSVVLPNVRARHPAGALMVLTLARGEFNLT